MNISNELLHACIKKDRKSQFQLYKSCFDVLMSVCMRYEKNREEATALLNMGFLKILKNLDKRQEKVPFEAWIRRIMINTVIDEYRKNKKTAGLIEYEDFQEETQHNQLYDHNEADKQFDAEELENMIKRLPPISQKVFNLHVIDGYSHKEIGTMLNISDGTSKWHVAFARQKLKGMIGKTLSTIQTVLL